MSAPTTSRPSSHSPMSYPRNRTLHLCLLMCKHPQLLFKPTHPRTVIVARTVPPTPTRVKSIDFHPVEPWIAAGTHSGEVYVWNYITKKLIKYFNINANKYAGAIRAVRFIPQKQCMIAGCDDQKIYVFNYVSMQLEKELTGHLDYIRSIAIHPTLPQFLSCADDQSVILWSWDTWKLIRKIENHKHYAMSVVYNPTNPNQFASSSLDRTVVVGEIDPPAKRFVLDAHERGINMAVYTNKGEIISAADDRKILIWRAENRNSLIPNVLKGHLNNVSAVCQHPTHNNILISGSEDKTIRLWAMDTGTLLHTIKLTGRCWMIECLAQRVAYGTDDGLYLLEVTGSESNLEVKSEQLMFPESIDNVECFTHLQLLPVENTKYLEGFQQIYPPLLDGLISEEEFKGCLRELNSVWKHPTKMRTRIFYCHGGYLFLILLLYFILCVTLLATVKQPNGLVLTIVFLSIPLGVAMNIRLRWYTKEQERRYAEMRQIISRVNDEHKNAGFQFLLPEKPNYLAICVKKGALRPVKPCNVVIDVGTEVPKIFTETTPLLEKDTI